MSGQDSADLDLLISLYLDGDIQEEDFTRLESLLKSDRECVEYFVARVADHCRTAELVHGYFLPFLSLESEQIFQDKSGKQQLEDSGECQALRELHLARASRQSNTDTGTGSLAFTQLASEGSHVIGKFVKQHAKALAIAAAVAIAAVLTLVFLVDQDPATREVVNLTLPTAPAPDPVLPPELDTTPDEPQLQPEPQPQPEPNPQPEPQPEPQPVPQPEVIPARPMLATVNELIGAEWADADWQARDELKSGNYKLVNGSVLLQMASGAKALITAPAIFTLTGTNELVLDTGTLNAQVPPQAMGFTVITPDARIVDIGTEFSVAIDEEAANTTVSVHVGEVRASAKAGDPNTNPPKALLAGDAVSVGKQATLKEVDYVPGGFTQAVKVARSQPEFTGGAVLFSKTPPADLRNGKSTEWKLQLFQEQEGVELTRNVTVNVTPGMKWPIPNSNVRRQLKAGIKVDVYLIHVDSDTAFSTKTHTIRFDRPIVGIATSPTALRATDVLARKGHQRTYDSDMDYRGLEPNDVMQLSADGMTLTVQLKTEKQTVDNARLFVLSQEIGE